MLSLAQTVIRRCRTLAGYSEHPGEITRTCLSAPMHRVHQDVFGWMSAVGMTVSIDAAGNIRGVLHGSSSSAGCLYLGSHLDTVPNAGPYDGILGVMWALAVVEALGETPLRYSVEVIGFSDEEGVRFGVPFIGSRALVGAVDNELLARCDASGKSLVAALRDFGLDEREMPNAVATPDAIGYLECLIEQGPVLDHLQLPLAVVEHIVGQTRAEVVFTGAAGHAGTTPMDLRRDAAAGAAEWILAVERLAKETPGLVATTGRVEAHPGVLNVIAGSCLVGLDIRHRDDETRQAAVGRLREVAAETAARRRLTVEWTTRLDQPATVMAPGLTSALRSAIAETGHPLHAMPSGAGHDAMIVAARMPAAMLFVRSPGGISHHPDESVLEGDVAAAIEVGRQTLLILDGRTPG